MAELLAAAIRLLPLVEDATEFQDEIGRLVGDQVTPLSVEV